MSVRELDSSAIDVGDIVLDSQLASAMYCHVLMDEMADTEIKWLKCKVVAY